METKIKNLLARLAFFAEEGMAEPPIVAIAKDADALLKELCRAQPEQAQQAEPVAFGDDVVQYIGRWGGHCRDCADNMGICHTGLPCGDGAKAITHVLSALAYGINNGFLQRIAAQPPAQPVALRSVTNISMETVGGNHRVVLHVGTVGEMYELGKVIRAMFAAEGCGACGDGCKGQGCRLERESPPTCLFCNGRGIVSRYAQDGSHDDAPCPDCAAQKGGA